jgi:hypothetical protein
MTDALVKWTAAALYQTCILPSRAAGRLLGWDPLRLRRTADQDSYWVPKASPGSLESYFSPGSGRAATPRATTAWYLPLYYTLAKVAASKRRLADTETRTSAAARDEGIPDEIYTLW